MVQEVIFLRKFLTNLGFPQTAPTPVFADNETCIAWSEGSVGGSDRAKHVDLRKFVCILYMRLGQPVIFSSSKLRADSMVLIY
jgi:hypothetical protein